MTTYSYKQARAIVMFEAALQQERAKDASNQNVLGIPLILAGVGVGKTALAHEVATEFDLDMISVNCGESSDATDLTGFPLPSEVQKDDHGKYIAWVMTEMMHRASKEPVVFFFDDIDKIPGLVEGALIGLFGKREMKGRKLHPGTILLAAGNRVSDDTLARQLSESIRTRVTPIEMEPSLRDFERYAEKTGKVHPTVLGFLRYKTHLLHAHNSETLRFPTPRGWVEASNLMFHAADGKSLFNQKEKDGWRTFVDLKCGPGAASDYWAWYSITRKVDVEKLLLEGIVVADVEKKDEHMIQYAATYAVSQELNLRGVKASYVGIEKFLEAAHPEVRVSALSQLSKKVRDAISTKLPKVGDMLLRDLLQSEDE